MQKISTTKNSPRCWKFDMHVHSWYSGDSTNSPEKIVEIFRKSGVLPLVCDHNTTAGSAVVYRAIRKLNPEIPKIMSEEILTGQGGEIIGLFLTEMIRPFLTVGDTLDIIHGQGGLALVPHPFCSFRTNTASWGDTLIEHIGDVDIIEGFNGRNLRKDNFAAVEFARKFEKPTSVGSDSHNPADLGRYWLETDPFATPDELLANLKNTRM